MSIVLFHFLWFPITSKWSAFIRTCYVPWSINKAFSFKTCAWLLVLPSACSADRWSPFWWTFILLPLGVTLNFYMWNSIAVIMKNNQLKVPFLFSISYWFAKCFTSDVWHYGKLSGRYCLLNSYTLIATLCSLHRIISAASAEFKFDKKKTLNLDFIIKFWKLTFSCCNIYAYLLCSSDIFSKTEWTLFFHS